MVGFLLSFCLEWIIRSRIGIRMRLGRVEERRTGKTGGDFWQIFLVSTTKLFSRELLQLFL